MNIFQNECQIKEEKNEKIRTGKNKKGLVVIGLYRAKRCLIKCFMSFHIQIQ